MKGKMRYVKSYLLVSILIIKNTAVPVEKRSVHHKSDDESRQCEYLPHLFGCDHV